MLLFPVYIKPEVTEATSKTATPSTLTFTSTRSSATVHLDSINAVSGSFATSTQEQTASFSISTNNATGYTLTLKTTGNDTALTDNTNSNTSTNHLNTISSSTTADDFTVNTWGLIPSKYNGSANTTTYYPASSTGFTIDETTTANTTANNYTVGIGIKVNYDTRSATYANDTLVAEYVANPVTYSISYYSNTSDTVDDMPLTNPQTGTISDPTTSTGDIITTLASAPTRDGYTFLGWCAGNSAGTADITNNTSITNITTTDDVDTCSSTVYDADQSFGINATSSNPDAYYLYAMWAPEAPDLPCEAGYICYRGNGATAGTMPDQEVTTSTVMLTSSNFSRPGYGFAGWNTSSDGTGTSYGPAETINPGDLSTEGLKLYAKWLAPSGVLQTWAGANNMNAGDVIALRDNRDNEVYTVAKLADNNIWITENLRLVPNTANITAKNTHNPTDTFLSALSSSSSSTTQCSADTPACNDHVYFYTGNMDRTKTQSPINNDAAYAWYSYGTMYNWYTATAGNGINSKTSGSVTGDICPSGWHLPTGGSSGEYAALSSALGGNSSTGATNIRKYPNNFIWSGDYNPSTQIPDGRGTQARIWSSTANSAAKSYRMGFNSSSITPAGTWNKWDNFAVRCIYQGGNLPYSAVTVDFEGTGITSLTFTSQGYDTETATPASPTISIVESAEYTVTANLTTGYEVSSWSTTTNGILGDTTTTNPAVNPNTYTITDDATLTVAGQITPTYDVTVTLGEHVTGISFSHPTYGTINITPQNSTDNGDGTYTNTTTLYRGVEYTLASSYEDGYTLHEWVVGANSTIGSTTSSATTYSITGNTTLGITAEETDELTYTLVYSAGQGTDAPDSETETVYINTHDFTITNSAPIYYGYTFTGWSETPDANNNGTTVDYTSGDTITLASTGATTTKTLYPVYQAVSSCPSGKICYYENGADVINGGRGTMSNQSASSNTDTNLIPTNYSKAGYGFAGWTTSENATPYGPNATITTPDLSSTGLSLYAKWVKSTGALQSWSGCNALAQNSVIALTDTRDNETYAVAKLADDNCWIVENLRLVPSTANITNQNTHNPASGFATAAASSSSVNTMCNTDGDTSCNDQIQYNTNSLNRSLTQTYNGNNNSSAWYSYGVYYNWYTATAGNGTISTEANANVTGDICPARWHLPTSTASGEYAALNTAVNNSTSSDAGLRAYPANFLWSGDYKNTQRNSSYSNGRYWTATGYDSDNGYRFGLQSTSVTPSGNYRKWDGFAVRCIYDGETPTYNTVTVTIPEHATSITFSHNKYGTSSAINSGTISLVQGATYTITASFASGYELDSWINGNNSTIGSSVANPTTFSILADTTLSFSVQFEQPPASCSTPVPNITYMQDIVPSNITSVTASLTTNVAYYLRDARDNLPYCVSKLEDGNIWMLDNLRLDPTAISLNSLRGNTNATDAELGYLKNGGGTTSDQYATAGVSNNWKNNDYYSIPLIAASGACYDKDYCANDPSSKQWNKESVISSNGQGSGKVGVYYNYCAASAGSYCYGDKDSPGTSSGDATSDICPSSWRMPNDGYNFGELHTLYSTYSNDINNFTNAFSVALSGNYSSEANWQKDTVYLWTSARSTNYDMYSVHIDPDGIGYTNSSRNYYGYLVRCLLRPAAEYIYPITVNLGTGVSSISFYNATYGTQTVTPSSSNTVMLRVGATYTITSSFEPNYSMNTWSTTENGTLGNATMLATTYDIVGPATLSLTANYQDPNTCSAGYICYKGNNSNSITMSPQSVSQDSLQVTLEAANYQMPGYGFAGWNTLADGTGASYGPNETISDSLVLSTIQNTGLLLYAKWVPSSNNMQIWTGCSGLSVGDVTALTDTRNNQTYAVAKLADGQCWTIENSRLDSAGELDALNTNKPSLPIANNDGGSSTFLSDTTNPNIVPWCTDLSEACFNKSMVSTENTEEAVLVMNNINSNTYNYGNYYNWYSATSGNGTYEQANGNATGDICPKGWRLPAGSNFEVNADFKNLDIALGGDGSAQNSELASRHWRTYPNNFIFNGFVNGSSIDNRGQIGYYWTSTALNNNSAYYLHISNDGVNPAGGNLGKGYGAGVRCIAKPDYTINVLNDNITTDVNSIPIHYGESATITITPNVGYYLYNLSCPNGYTCTDYITGLEAYEQQTITITNNNTNQGGTISFTGAARPLPGECVNNATWSTCMQTMPTCPTTATEVVDARDGTRYKVKKMPDNKCWMLDNVAIDLINVPLETLQGNTNASDTTLEYLKGVRARDFDEDPYGSYATGAISQNNIYYNNYDKPGIDISQKNSVPSGAVEGSEGSNKYGGIYNYCAATAGSYCYSYDSYSFNQYDHPHVDSTEDICPAGWRMPSCGEYDTVSERIVGKFHVYTVGYEDEDAVTIRRALSLPLSYGSGGEWGNMWTRSWYTDITQWNFEYTESYIYLGIHQHFNNYRSRPGTLRCIMK